MRSRSPGSARSVAMPRRLDVDSAVSVWPGLSRLRRHSLSVRAVRAQKGGAGSAPAAKPPRPHVRRSYLVPLAAGRHFELCARFPRIARPVGKSLLQERGECDELDTANVTPTNDTASPASYRLGMKSMRTGGVMNSRHTRRLTIALGLVLTIAALVAPSANAKMQRIYSDHGVALVPVSSEPNPNMVYSDRGVTPITPESKSTPIQIYSDHGIATIPRAQSEPTQIASVSTDDPELRLEQDRLHREPLDGRAAAPRRRRAARRKAQPATAVSPRRKARALRNESGPPGAGPLSRGPRGRGVNRSSVPGSRRRRPDRTACRDSRGALRARLQPTSPADTAGSSPSR